LAHGTRGRPGPSSGVPSQGQSRQGCSSAPAEDVSLPVYTDFFNTRVAWSAGLSSVVGVFCWLPWK